MAKQPVPATEADVEKLFGEIIAWLEERMLLVEARITELERLRADA